MRRGVRGSPPPMFEVNLTPLLDVVLQLITFFMVLVHFGSRIEGEFPSVRLPTAPAALADGELGLDRLVVALDRSGVLLSDDLTARSLTPQTWWSRKATERRLARKGEAGPGPEIGTLVVIRADRDCPYGAVRKTLNHASAAGFGHFTLVVLREEAP